MLGDELHADTSRVSLKNGGTMEAALDLVAWEARLDKLVGDERFSGSIEVLVDGDAYFPRLIESALEANESVKMRTYIFDSDDYATALADMLRRRSTEVDVQVMVDGLGTLMAQEASAGTVPSDFEAPIAITNYLESESEVRVRSLTNPWAAGDHTKTTIIDSDHVYIGGMNVGREYRWEWHDMMMRVEGSIVPYIEREFDKAWSHGAVFGDFALAGKALANRMPESDEIEHPIRPLLTLPRRSEIYKAQVNKEMNLGSSDPAFVRDLIAKVFDPDFAAAAELQEPLPAGWKNTFASIVASQL